MKKNVCKFFFLLVISLSCKHGGKRIEYNKLSFDSVEIIEIQKQMEFVDSIFYFLIEKNREFRHDNTGYGINENGEIFFKHCIESNRRISSDNCNYNRYINSEISLKLQSSINYLYSLGITSCNHDSSYKKFAFYSKNNSDNGRKLKYLMLYKNEDISKYDNYYYQILDKKENIILVGEI